MLISTAYAQAAGGGGGFDLISFLPLILIVVIFYFLLIRPQQKRAKEHREMLAAVRRGDRIVTNGGLIGTVARVNENDETLQVEIAQGVRVQVVRGMVAEIRGKGEPLSSTKGKKGRDRDKAEEEDTDDAADDTDESAETEKKTES